MQLFLKGLIIGLGKIIPGVSGALLAINLNVYEKLVMAVTNFFDDVRNNIKFLLPLILGIMVSIIIGSNVIVFLFNNYRFITMLFFLGLIIGGTYIFSKKICFNIRCIMIIFLFLIIILLFNLIDIQYHFNSIMITYFFGGYIEILASIVPGISGTSILMSLGIYDEILNMVANLFNLKYVLDNVERYLFYIYGMLLSFIINIYIINYLINKYRDIVYIIVLCLSVISIIFLLFKVFALKWTMEDLIFGIIFFIGGIVISWKLS